VNNANLQILYIEPVMKQMVWGGSRLRDEFGYQIPGDDTGECWAVSAHPNGDCLIRGGEFNGQSLSCLWKNHIELFGNTRYDRFPLLAKIIDAKEDLSIQVHPDDSYAQKNENGSMGKTECWYVLDAPEDANLVIGHSATTKKELESMIENNRWEELLTKQPVKKGDFIQIDPGTVHAITAGVLILEIQQNSDITYRLYDYGRTSGGVARDLHIRQSLDVIKVPANSADSIISHCQVLKPDEMNLLVESDYYKVWKLEVKSKFHFEQTFPFLIINIIQGEGIINGENIKKGDHFILPSGYGKVELQGNIEMILSTIPEK